MIGGAMSISARAAAVNRYNYFQPASLSHASLSVA